MRIFKTLTFLMVAAAFTACTKTIVTQSDKMNKSGFEGPQSLVVLYQGDYGDGEFIESTVAKGLPVALKATSARELLTDTTKSKQAHLDQLIAMGKTALMVVKVLDYASDTVQAQVTGRSGRSLMEDQSMGFYSNQHYGVEAGSQYPEGNIQENLDKSRPQAIQIRRTLRLQGDIYDIKTKGRIYNCRTTIENPPSVKAIGKSFGKAVGKDLKATGLL
ncbi:hypothetical protein [Persicobacter sp. CCB-QB2]|uniref:hypothetical protein n=1 Tax=Persicobacter sp. CCB-QB2 TaxID=1561025 RepID=UPI0012F7D93A|nr:hypothetical protein [Persicobacter sp. CCB-QB2]